MTTSVFTEQTGYTRSYLADQHAGQLARLQTLERAFDPLSHRVFELLDLPDAPAILDLGAGAGSLAGWLSQRYPDATVTATDIDTRFLVDIPGIKVMTHNVTTDDFPAASFDVVHARALLCHLTDREEIVTRAATWLRPGGWLVIEDVSLQPSLGTTNPLLRKVAQAGITLLEQSIGSDMFWADGLPDRLRDRGLVNVGHRTLEGRIGDNSPADAFWAATTAQAGPALLELGLLTQADLDAMAMLRADPAFTDAALTLVSAWGQIL
ncbi:MULTISPECIES: class I SAM-dependent methyltransferase [Pseudomonas]|uniref:class I SAM-dependent methyltransferase n=1 Tax=Pseudomonas TaxID=286 RepID=UPI00190DAAA7|nr:MULTISPECIES: class I SAM-dependent methyltransferase [Pseudomonas]MBK3475784.1 class I SAM-dependent methyltransferase [Pseudomonas sp. MF6751]MBL4981540.1 class I SAM-dependent methyltransferase [Pseudomonas fluorescens]MBY8952857.1 class I SAM-dependent methyltransferase [Pseudomonas carnis]MCF5692195.1 methyltransferase domain-containing protein [Pseudomonas sp. PA-1-8C]MCF5789870.1 methyltransferase domain-containing protein [Pseudomonas sp. PA-1-6G]